jgi:cellulose synthase/poly-beta-1,6-N-acetylglucosamine synthase-like glycosyltransferase
MSIAELTFWASVLAVLYVFVGYPLILLLVRRLVQPRPILQQAVWPHVTLIISAYNEQQIIEEKIKNSLALDYPRRLLEVIVVSDASTDLTDNLVERYAAQGIVLKRMATRRGKTEGINESVPMARGDIIAFSDANVLYAKDAIQKIVRNFSDPKVGCVTGNSCYVGLESSTSGKSENIYWGYERFLKMSESAVGSLVGADGAIFAIRQELFSPLAPDDINDFVTPLQIVSRGYRNVFEPEALCYESTVSKLAQEFRRKVRIVSRSWHGLFRVKTLLNPRLYGWVSFQLISHKVLRWLTPGLLGCLFLSSFFLPWNDGSREIILGAQVLFYSLGAFGLFLDRAGVAVLWVSFPAYFLAVNAASAVGTISHMFGKKVIIWKPERSVPTASTSKTER